MPVMHKVFLDMTSSCNVHLATKMAAEKQTRHKNIILTHPLEDVILNNNFQDNFTDW